MHIGWIGNSVAILGRRRSNGTYEVINLTPPHTPESPTELSRIVGVGAKACRRSIANVGELGDVCLCLYLHIHIYFLCY